eukprot:COSAG05_NODE_579_length_8556_cov_44.773679_9_plen_54_part_00
MHMRAFSQIQKNPMCYRCSTSTLRHVTVAAAIVVVYANISLSVRVRVQLIGHL